MPTYKNISENVVNIPKEYGNETHVSFVSPGDTFTTQYYLPETSALQKIAETPLYLPVLAQVTLTGNAQIVEYTIHPDTEYIIIRSVAESTVIVYIAVVSAQTKLISVNVGETFTWDLKHRAQKLLFSFIGNGSCEILETREEIAM